MSPAGGWPRLSLGCGNFGGVGSAPAFFGRGASEEEAFAIMDAAHAGGIAWFDTADAYGGGTSETFIGRWRADRAVEQLLLTTKVFNPVGADPNDRGLAPARITRALEASLERLGVEQIDLYLAHDADPEIPIGATVEAFEELRARGLLGAWGLSNVDAAGIEAALAYGRPALVQNSYSLLERADEAELLPRCSADGIAYVPYGPLAGGWLTGKYARGAAYPPGSRMTMRPEPYRHFLADRVFDGLDALAADAARRGIDSATLAFAWVLSNPDVTGAVCGPARPAQLAPVIAALELALDDAEREHIGSFFSDETGSPRAPMSVRVLGEADVYRLLPVADCIEPMERVLAALARDELYNPLRFVIRPPGSRTLMGLMPAHRGGAAPLFALKTVCIAPGNAARGLDSHQGFVALFDGETGATRALFNAGAITAIRTAAVSAVATRLLARPGSTRLAILGAGIQARSHLEAMRAVLTLEHVSVWSRTPGRASLLPGVEEAASAREAVAGADVIVTATSAREPVLEHSWLAEGAHINAVGSSIPTTRELDTATMADCALYVDRRESTLNEAGDYLFAAADGAIGPDSIRGEIGELLIGAAEGRRSESELTVFKSLGLAVEDLAAAEFVLERALAQGAGVEVEL